MSDDPVDVRPLPYMPLHIQRLQKSKAWLRCKRRPELAFYIMNLWMRAWHEVPAGSIEDDDDVLADAAMCPPETWDKIRADVLSGWDLREDGRWHHSVVMELAEEASGKLRANRKRTEKAREAKVSATFEDLSGATDDQSILCEPSVTDVVTEPVTEPVTDAVTGHEGKGREGKRKKEYISSSLRSEDYPPSDEIRQAVEAWNATAGECGLSAVRALTEARKKSLKLRLSEAGGIDGWRHAMARIRESAFLRGENDRGWRADFDFALQPKSFAKLMEGAYGQARASPKPPSMMETIDRVCGRGQAAPRDMGTVIEIEAER